MFLLWLLTGEAGRSCRYGATTAGLAVLSLFDNLFVTKRRGKQGASLMYARNGDKDRDMKRAYMVLLSLGSVGLRVKWKKVTSLILVDFVPEHFVFSNYPSYRDVIRVPCCTVACTGSVHWDASF